MSQTILFNHPSFLSKPASQIVVIQDSLQLFGSSNLCAIGHDLVSRRIKRNMISTIQRTNVPADLRHPTTGFPACSRTSNPDPICLSVCFILITGIDRSRKMKGKSVSKKQNVFRLKAMMNGVRGMAQFSFRLISKESWSGLGENDVTPPHSQD